MNPDSHRFQALELWHSIDTDQGTVRR